MLDEFNKKFIKNKNYCIRPKKDKNAEFSAPLLNETFPETYFVLFTPEGPKTSLKKNLLNNLSRYFALKETAEGRPKIKYFSFLFR